MDSSFLQAHNMDARYLDMAKHYFVPALHWLVAQANKASARPLIVGINGSQGAGKSTLADYGVRWCDAHGLSACAVSIDDFYHTRAHRQILAETVHPLLATRGVPGTHDVNAAMRFFQALTHGEFPLQVPRFNKAADEPFPPSEWPVLMACVDIVFFEGWCVGSLPQPTEQLRAPVNALEAEQDRQGRWRQYVNTALEGPYRKLFDLLDHLLLLKAPSFEYVAQWRWEQEEKLIATLTDFERANAQGLMSREAVSRFVSFYERITRDNIKRLPDQADIVYSLSEQRDIIGISGKHVCLGTGVSFEIA
jgi:D-glycerate 3-kinase